MFVSISPVSGFLYPVLPAIVVRVQQNAGRVPTEPTHILAVTTDRYNRDIAIRGIAISLLHVVAKAGWV